jgi:RHS repeat-associated protein
MPGRKYSQPNNNYRYGFNGIEKDSELKGEGNSYTTEYRAYDPRVGRWFSVDPKTKMQPYESPYVAMNNSPLWRNDPKGDIAPIIIWALKKLGEAAIGVMTDVAVQIAAEKYFGNNGNGHATWGAAWNSLDVDWWQAIQSGGENLVKNKHLSAALSAGGDMLNYYINTDDATWEGAFARGGMGAVSAYIGGGVSKFIAKYGAKPVAKGLAKMGAFSDDAIKQLTGFSVVSGVRGIAFGNAKNLGHIVKHAKYLGVSGTAQELQKPANVQKLKDAATNFIKNADEVRAGKWDDTYADALFYRNGDNIIVTDRATGNFITAADNAAGNKKFDAATKAIFSGEK